MTRQFSMIIPCEQSRVPLLIKTLDKYKEYGGLENIEFIFVSRTLKEIPYDLPDSKLIIYKFNHEIFNPAMALNLGVRASKYPEVIITCPEVMPLSNVLQQLQDLPKGNYLCQVFDTNEHNQISISLINNSFRANDPGLYFLALYQKEDLYKINGWDEEFMTGLAFEDTDFGNRFNRAGIPYTIREDIRGLHQYHERVPVNDGWHRNQELCLNNTSNNVITCKRGLR